jgi:hypothetical protein
MNDFFDELALRWVEAAAARGAAVEPPTLDPAVAGQLLDLARAVAHGEERRFAPLATYLAGVACERLRSAGRAATPADLAAYIAEVRASLESRSAPE